MPTPYSETNFHTENIRAFAAEVERLTDGELVIEVRPGGTLVAHAEIAEAVQNGDVQIGEVFQSTLSSRSPLFGADGLPFLATTYADARRLADAEFDILTRILAEDGLIPLYSVPWPPQGLYSKQEIIDPVDLNGAAFRVNNDILNGFATELGANPTRLEVSEIPGAFRSGAIDAMMTSATTGVSTQSWEYLDYYYDLQAWLPKNIVLVNSDALAALSEENRQAVFTAALSASDNGWLMSQINAVEAIKALFDNGMTILTPGQDLSDSGEGGAMRQVSPALLRELERASQATRQSWLQTAGSDGQQLMNIFEEGQE